MILIPEGWKTYIAALIAGLVAVNAILKVVPDDLQNALLALAAALGLYGLRQAISTGTKATSQQVVQAAQEIKAETKVAALHVAATQESVIKEAVHEAVKEVQK